jgi:ribonuclease Z
MTQRILRLLAGLTGLLFLALGLMCLFAPGNQTGQFGLLPASNTGLNTLRGDLGGLFLGLALFSLFGAIGASSRWLSVPAVFLGFIIFGRILSLLLDGRSRESVQSLVVEVVLAAVVLLALASRRPGQPGKFGLGPAIALPILLVGALAVAFLFQRQLGLTLFKRNAARSLENSLLATLPEGLHAGLCGSGSPLPDSTRAGPCVFVIAGTRVYIVDAGDGSPRKLGPMGLSPGLIDAILLTHFHSDHIDGLGEMMLQRWGGGSHKDPVPVIGPQGVESVVEGFNEAYAQDKKYRVAHHGEAVVPSSGAGGVAHPFTLVEGSDASQVVLEQDGLTITAFPVNHSPVFPAAGYRFDYRGRSVVISGDTAPSATLVKYSRGTDVLFHEGLQTAMVSALQDAAERHGRGAAAKIFADIPSYHTTPEDAARIAQQAGVRYLMFYHTIPALPLSYLNAAFLGNAPKIFMGPITVGRDGMMVSLPVGSTVVTMRELL